MLVKKRLCFFFSPWRKERRGEGWRVEAAGDRCVCIYTLPVEALILSFQLLSLLGEWSVNELRIIIFLMWEFVFFLYAGTTAEIQVGLRRWVRYVLLCDATNIPFIDTLCMHAHSIYVNIPIVYYPISLPISILLSSPPRLIEYRLRRISNPDFASTSIINLSWQGYQTSYLVQHLQQQQQQHTPPSSTRPHAHLFLLSAKHTISPTTTTLSQKRTASSLGAEESHPRAGASAGAGAAGEAGSYKGRCTPTAWYSKVCSHMFPPHRPFSIIFWGLVEAVTSVLFLGSVRMYRTYVRRMNISTSFSALSLFAIENAEVLVWIELDWIICFSSS